MPNNNSFDFTSIIDKHSNTSSNSKSKNPINNLAWYKKKANIIAMSSVLGVGALAIVVAVPVALLVPGSATDSNPGGGTPGPNPGPVLPPATNTIPIAPSDYFSIQFNEQEIKKYPVSQVTELIIYNNMIFPTGSPISKDQLTIKELVKNIEMNFVSFSLSSNFNQQFVTKTIYWDVTYSATDPNALYNNFLTAWNALQWHSPKARWDFFYYPFVSSSPTSTWPLSYRQNVGATSLLYYLTGDLRFNDSIYNYANNNMNPGETKESYSIQRWLAGIGTNAGPNGDMVPDNKNSEFFEIESVYTIVQPTAPNNFIAKLPYKIQYYFNQSFTLKEFTTNAKKYWEVTFPINSVRVVISQFANLNTNIQNDQTLKPNPINSRNTQAITFRTSQELLI